MKILDRCKRVKELDSRYLEWFFYRDKWMMSGFKSKHYARMMNYARRSYENLVLNRNSKGLKP